MRHNEGVAGVWGKLNLKDQADILVVNAPPSFEPHLKYTCEFNRDTGFQPLGDAGFEPVRMVAIDDDWTAMRVRRVEFIKTLTRPESFALSTEGKKRTARR